MTIAKSKPFRFMLVFVLLLIAGEFLGMLFIAPILPPAREFIDAQEWRYVDWIEMDHEVFWRYRPSRVIDGKFLHSGQYTINSHGYRGPEFDLGKKPGVVRVVCLGESNTFGLGVADDAVWPRQLESRLNAIDPQRRQWEVLNLAVTNYSTFQGVRQARYELPRLKPDIVMYCYSWADHQPAADGISDDHIDAGAVWQVTICNLLNRSTLWRWLVAAWSQVTTADTPSQAQPGFEQRRVATTDFAENLGRIAREAQAIGARPIAVTSPIAWPPDGMDDDSGIFHVHHRYRRLARYGSIAGGGEFVELANAFDNYRRFYDDPSREIALFNAQGHAFTGEFLARFILGDSVVVARYGSQIYTEGR